MHVPVLLKEVIEYLKPAEKIVDATANGGGHLIALAQDNPERRLVGIEWDSELVKSLKSEVESRKLEDRITIINDSYVNLKKIVLERNFQPDGILFDLGLSSWHYEESGRGFSFKRDELLDMRFSEGGPTAADIVNSYDPREIERILREYGEEQFARDITRAIIARRKQKPILRTSELVEVVSKAVPFWYARKKIHFATKTFQALRIAVNRELENVRKGIEAALEVLSSRGLLAVIAFHGLEDKIIKEFFKTKARENFLHLVHKKAIKPGEDEIRANPRARSAKMRVAEKI